ncbi:serine/threonine protein phosphatase [Myxococcota bacterium]|nr:serine/threonine protein phosphatase [Myxococcota bacterium]
MDTETDLRDRMAAILGLLQTRSESPGSGDSRQRVLPLEPGHLYAVVGDLHGDFAAFDDILRSFFPRDLTEEEAARRHVLLLGDILDRGRRDLQLLHALLALREVLGERLILMRGNHEHWVADEEGALRTTAEGGQELLLNYLRGKVPDGNLLALHRFFEGMPHVLLLTHPAGGALLVHAGVPPEFLVRKYLSNLLASTASPEELLQAALQVENIRSAFLWGRGPLEGVPRPDRPYPYRRFYPEDVESFLGVLGARVLLRGHDTENRGYGVQMAGRCITVSSSGTALAGRNPDSYFDHTVQMPRYLVLDGDRFGLGQRGSGEYEHLDAGIAVREVFGRDVVVLVDEESQGPGQESEAMTLARKIHQALPLASDVPIHLYQRRLYSVDAAEFLVLLEPRIARFDRELDRSFHARYTFHLSREEGRFRLRRWRGPWMPDREEEDCREEDSRDDFVRKCAAFLVRILDLPVAKPGVGSSTVAEGSAADPETGIPATPGGMEEEGP